METVKCLNCGRNIVQQRKRSVERSGNYGVATYMSVTPSLELADDLAGIATGELLSVSQLNQEPEER